MRVLFLSLLALILLGWGVVSAPAATVGQELNDVQIRDAEDRPAHIPDFGRKLIGLFYNDADVSDLNDPLADAIKAQNFDRGKYEGIGIGNLKDSKLPNFLIRKIIKAKVEKYQVTILTDPGLTLARAWDLGDCNNTAVFLLIGKDRRVKYVKKGPIRGAEVDAIVQMIGDLIR
ncbi:MAG: YtfJ family protein [candidate division NC10 bacterium]|nr:YtfJ family protein [candidate division NC10 bacterium]